YALPDDRREMRAARYLNWRINRRVNAEDTALIERVQQGMASRSFSAGPLSDKEVCLRHFCCRMRDLIPEARQETPPPKGWSNLSPSRLREGLGEGLSGLSATHPPPAPPASGRGE